MKKSLTLVFLLFLPLYATKYAGEIFELNPNVRATSFGNVAVALNSSPSGFYSNPAIILERRNVFFNYTSLFGGLVSYNFIGFTLGNIDGRNTRFAAGLSIISAGDIKETSLINPEDGISQGNIYIKDYLNFKTLILQFSLSRAWKSSRLGVKFKIFNEDLSVTSGTGFGLDAGLFKQYKNFTLGTVIRDFTYTPIFWESHKEYIYPSISIGATYLLKGHFLLGSQFDFLFEGRDNSAPFSVGLASVTPHFGFAYKFPKVVTIRTGIDNSRLTVGFGIDYKRLSLNYAYTGHSDLGSTSKLSLSILL